MAHIKGCGENQICEDDLHFETGQGITNRDSTASIIATASGWTITGTVGLAGGSNITDGDALTFGTGGTDVVMTADGTDMVVTATGDVVVADNVDLMIGTGKDLSIKHDGTDTLIVGANGDIVIDNTDVNDLVIVRVGTDTTATGVEIRNNSDAVMLSVTPSSATAGTTLVVGVLDLNGTLDQDAALTGTGDAANISATISHATQTAEALDVSIAQITNVRTSGDVIAIKSSITSFTGTTAGVDHVAYDGACTAGDADSDHILLRQGANFSRTIDSSAAATGETAWLLAANRADALSILDSTGDVVTITTTTGDLSINVPDNVDLNIGTGDDLSVLHDGSNTLITSATGDLTIDNTAVTGSTIVLLGTDTSAVDFQVQNNSAAALFSVTPSSATAGTALVAGVLDLNGTLDQDVALTATGDAANIAATMNHATQVAEGLDVSIAQITNVRTSGSLSAVRASVTSLTGDTAGVDYYAYEAAVTVGEAGADHFALKQGAGFDYTLDASAAATAQTGALLGANLPDAWSFADSTGDVLTLTTTTGDLSVNIPDNVDFQIGTGDDLAFLHNGTNTLITSATGDLTIDNTAVTGSTIILLGTDTTAVDFQVQNNSAAAIFSVTPSSATEGTTLVAGILDMNGAIDQDQALTATGDSFNLRTTMSHASQVAEGIDVGIAQITNVRTSGSLSAVKASVTSLSGDTAGVDYACFEAAVTVGEANADHIVLKQGAGFDYTIDSSAAASGQVVWLLPDAAANALTIEDSAGNDFLVIDTAAVDGITLGNATTNPVLTVLGTGGTNVSAGTLTAGAINASGTVAITARATTTDGVAAGTARVIGGQAYGIVTDGTFADPAGAGDAAETVIATYTVPTNSIKSGTKIRVDFAYVMTVGATVETLVMRLRLGGVGGTIVASSTSADPGTGSGSGYALLVGRAAPAASASVAHFGVMKDIAAAGADSTVVQQGPTLTNFATNGNLDLVLTADFAAAEAAGGDTIAVRIFEVDVTG